MKPYLSLESLRKLNRSLVEDQNYNAEKYSSTMSRACQGVNDPRLHAERMIAIGCKFAENGKTNLAFKHLARARKLYNNLPDAYRDPWWGALMHSRYGLAYDDVLNFEASLTNHLKSLKINRQIKNKKAIRRDLLNIGFIYLQLGSDVKAIKYLTYAAHDQNGSPYVVSGAYAHLATAYELAGDLERAKKYYLKAFSITPNKSKKIGFLALSASLSIILGKLSDAETLVDRASNIEVASAPSIGMSVLLLIAKAQLASARHDHQQARKICDFAFEIAQAAGDELSLTRLSIQQAQNFFSEGRLKDCQALLIELLDKRLPYRIRIEAKRLALRVFQTTSQWQTAYELLQNDNSKMRFTKFRLNATQQLINFQQHNKGLKKKNNELMALHQEKDEFFGMVAHDLNNPLSAALMSIEILSKYRSRLATSHLQQNYQRAIGSLQYASNIVSQLTASMESEAKSGEEIAYKPLALDKLIVDIVEENTGLAQHKNQRLVIDKLTPITMAGNPLWIRQILSNLISNAIKYSSPGSTTSILLLMDQSGKQAQIIVIDEGLGFSEKDMELVFNRYTKLSAIPTGNETSTGLGLYISKKLAEKMGGTLTVTSEGKLKGSSFFVKLPIRN